MQRPNRSPRRSEGDHRKELLNCRISITAVSKLRITRSKETTIRLPSDEDTMTAAQIILTCAETDGAKNAIPSRLHSLDSYFSMMILRLSTGNFRREFGAPFSKLSFLLNAVFVSYSKRSKFRKPYS